MKSDDWIQLWPRYQKADISSGLLRLHPDPAALGTLPFSFLMKNVPLEFFHRNFAGFAGHGNPLPGLQ